MYLEGHGHHHYNNNSRKHRAKKPKKKIVVKVKIMQPATEANQRIAKKRNNQIVKKNDNGNLIGKQSVENEEKDPNEGKPALQSQRSFQNNSKNKKWFKVWGKG